MRDQLMTSNRQDWETPGWLFNKLNGIFQFSLDAAASTVNHKCDLYLTEEQDALKIDWARYLNLWCQQTDRENTETVWLNPPYGPNLLPFMKKVKEEYYDNGLTIVCLTPARTETKFFRIAWTYARYFVFLYGRLKFELDGIPQQSATYPSVITVFSPRKWNLEPLKEYGKILEQNVLTKKEIYSLL